MIAPAAAKKPPVGKHLDPNKGDLNLVGVRLAGGLGNQLFQYAFASALAKKHGAQLAADLSWFQACSNSVRRSYRLDRLGCRPSVLAPERSRRLFGTPGTSPWRRWIRRLGLSTHPGRVWEETPGNSSRILRNPEDARLPLLLDGHWLRPELFSRNRAQFRNLFQPTRIPRAASQLAGTISRVESVGIHVRRGDYVAIRGFPHLPAEWYRRACGDLGLRDARAFVFSDDPGWCRQHLQLPIAWEVVSVAPESPETDLWLLSQCRHHVLSASTFSWWGAFLAGYARQRVRCPDDWGPVLRSYFDPQTFFPPHWRRI